MTDLNERALMIARKVIAQYKEREQAPASAALVRSGEWDNTTEVKIAAMGALAALVAEAELMEELGRELRAEAGRKYMVGKTAASINYRNAAELIEAMIRARNT